MTALAWTLLHFLWQGALIGLVALIGRWLFASTQVRYNFLCATLAASAALPVWTYWEIQRKGSFVVGQATLGEPAAKMLGIAWLTGAVVGLVHLSVSYTLLRRRLLSGYTPNLALNRLVVQWAERLQIRGRVEVIVTSAIHSPAVAGIRSVCLYMPIAALARLSPEQVETIVVHELVHARRLDPLVNLVQSCIERLLFFHPAVWWLSEQIRVEREHLCDDETLSLLPNRLVYASALAELEGIRHRPVGKLVVAGAGGVLVERIARILGKPPKSSSHGSVLSLAVCAILMCLSLLLGSVHQAPAQNKPTPRSAYLDALWKQDQELDRKTDAYYPNRPTFAVSHPTGMGVPLAPGAPR